MFLQAFLLGCAAHHSVLIESIPGAVPTASAEAQLEPRSGSTVSGRVTFQESSALPAPSVDVVIEVSGATPGEHGVHVHEKGDCSAPDAASAGGHFNPMGHPHGDATSAEHHPGDLGNLTVGPDGTGRKALAVSTIRLVEGPTAVAGLSVIVHALGDDFSGPSGNAGARQACGVIALNPSASPAK